MLFYTTNPHPLPICIMALTWRYILKCHFDNFLYWLVNLSAVSNNVLEKQNSGSRTATIRFWHRTLKQCPAYKEKYQFEIFTLHLLTMECCTTHLVYIIHSNLDVTPLGSTLRGNSSGPNFRRNFAFSGEFCFFCGILTFPPEFWVFPQNFDFSGGKVEVFYFFRGKMQNTPEFWLFPQNFDFSLWFFTFSAVFCIFPRILTFSSVLSIFPRNSDFSLGSYTS